MQKLYEAVLGEKNSAYYLSKFQKFDQQPSGLQASWNLCAFFFSGLWALHRKMYGWFFVFWGVAVINKITTPESSAHLHELVISTLLFLVPAIVFGIFADSLYHHSVKKKIAKAQLTIKDKAQLVEFLRKKGGVNTWVTWFFFGVPVIVTVVFATINALQTYKIINKAPTGVELIFFLSIVLTIIFAVYTHWFKKETLQKYTNADWKETKPQNPSEKTESIPSSELYEIIAGEMERNQYKKGLMTRAFAEANGDKELSKSLYIKFRYAELFSEMELERKEKQRQQMEVDRIDNERTETPQEQSIWSKDLASFNWNWVAFIGVCFVAFLYWSSFTSTTPATVTTSVQPPVTTVPVQNAPQATPPDNYDFLKTYKPPSDTQANHEDALATKGTDINSRPAGMSAYDWAMANSPKNEEILQRANDLYKQNRYTEALPLYQGLAEQGNVKAQANLGLMYWLGKGVAKDDQKAAELYRKAAEQGNVIAQYNLGAMYKNGYGVTQDYNQAIYWYSKAAEQGYVFAQYGLGEMFDLGEVVAQNVNQAAYWYNKAALQGHAIAQYRLGEMYKNGVGVAQNYNQAFFWYKKAAEQSYVRAIDRLGELYKNGQGVAQDYNQAAYWSRQAEAIRKYDRPDWLDDYIAGNNSEPIE